MSNIQIVQWLCQYEGGYGLEGYPLFVFTSKRILQPKLDLPHRDLKSDDRTERCGRGVRRSNASGRPAECRVIGEIERLETKCQRVTFSHAEALVSGEIPILLARTTDHVAASITDHTLRRNHHGGRVEPLAGRWMIELEWLSGGIWTRAILKSQ